MLVVVSWMMKSCMHVSDMVVVVAVSECIQGMRGEGRDGRKVPTVVAATMVVGDGDGEGMLNGVLHTGILGGGVVDVDGDGGWIWWCERWWMETI